MNEDGAVDVADIAAIIYVMGVRGVHDNADVVINLDYQTANNVVGASFTLYLPDGLLLKGFTYENLEQWVVGVAETGTFYARSSANWTVDANNGNPKDIGRA